MKRGETLTYKQFKANERYIYYCPELDDIIVGSVKHHTLYMDIADVCTLTLTYVGEL